MFAPCSDCKQVCLLGLLARIRHKHHALLECGRRTSVAALVFGWSTWYSTKATASFLALQHAKLAGGKEEVLEW